jgi:predicted  nucleic acid-binding Zn-ribbon protein
VESLSARVAELESTLTDRQTELSSAQAAVEAANARLTAKRNERKAATTAAKTTASIETRLQQMGEENEQLTSQLSESERQRDELQSSLVALQTKATGRQKEQARIKAALDIKYQTNLAQVVTWHFPYYCCISYHHN